MTTDLHAAARPDHLTDALRRHGVLSAGRVRNITADTPRDTLLSRIVRLKLAYEGPAERAPASLIPKTWRPREGVPEAWAAREVLFYDTVAPATPAGALLRCFRNLSIVHGDAHVWNFFLPNDGSAGGERLFDWSVWRPDLPAIASRDSSAEDGVDAGEDEIQSPARDFADAIDEHLFVQCDDERDICNRVLWQACLGFWHQDVSGGLGPFEIAGEWHADHGANATTIDRVALDDDDRSSVPGFRPGGLIEIRPPDFRLLDYHSTRRMTVRAARLVKGSAGSSAAVTT